MLRSWDIEAKVEKKEQVLSDDEPVIPFSAGLWADYDIDDKTLRQKTWGTYKRVH